MTEAYTVSKMLNGINEVMAPVAEGGTSVTLKRRLENGIMMDTSDKEIAYLDLQAKVKHAALQVAQLEGRQEKLRWAQSRRELGNEAFRAQQYQEAADHYLQALTGLDFGDSTETKRECQQQWQLPLTCNLAACMLMMEQWEKARQVATQALQVGEYCVKARQQRAKALMRLCKFEEAR